MLSAFRNDLNHPNRTNTAKVMEDPVAAVLPGHFWPILNGRGVLFALFALFLVPWTHLGHQTCTAHVPWVCWHTHTAKSSQVIHWPAPDTSTKLSWMYSAVTQQPWVVFAKALLITNARTMVHPVMHWDDDGEFVVARPT